VITGRRYDLDWLRVIAFAVLIYFHAAIIFIPGGLPMIQNAETSRGLLAFVEFSHLFRLSLLFLISGVGVYFARRRRTPREFVAERSRRLLVPLAVGLVVIVPPMVYLERLHLDEFTGHILSFYPTLVTTGLYPAGNLSWHHLWFIVYLYLYCVIGLKVFPLVESHPYFRGRFGRWSQGYHVFGFVLPLFLAELSLRWAFPGIPDLVSDWANFFHFLMVFVAGYVIASDVRILDRVVALRRLALTVTVVAAIPLFGWFYGEDGLRVDPMSDTAVIEYIAYCALKMALVWSILLACLGYAGRFLNRPSRWLGYLNEAVYPLFLLHLTVITALGYPVVEWSIPLWTKYLIITTGTIIVVFMVYEFVIRPSEWLRLAFGVKPRAR